MGGSKCHEEPGFIGFFRVNALWFYTETLSKGKAPFGYGINLGVDPLKEWGQDKVRLFDAARSGVPRDIVILRLPVRMNNINLTLTTGAGTLQNGHEAMFRFMNKILELRNKPWDQNMNG